MVNSHLEQVHKVVDADGFMVLLTCLELTESTLC